MCDTHVFPNMDKLLALHYRTGDNTELSQHKEALEKLFAEADERRRRRTIPDSFLCKISYELMQDPVVTPSGISYERRFVLQHLSSVGSFDPVNRAPLQPSDLIPNLGLKSAIDDFIADNPWAEWE